jgi:NTE family protein
MPVVFPVRHIDGFELVDGGTLDPVPVVPARSLLPKLPVIAVTLGTPMGTGSKTWSLPIVSYLPRVIVDRFSRMRYGLMLDVFVRSFDIISRAVSEYRLEMDKPDIIVRPRVGNIDTLDIIDVHEVVTLGEAAVDEVLPQLKQKFTLRNRFLRALGAKA